MNTIMLNLAVIVQRSFLACGLGMSKQHRQEQFGLSFLPNASTHLLVSRQHLASSGWNFEGFGSSVSREFKDSQWFVVHFIGEERVYSDQFLGETLIDRRMRVQRAATDFQGLNYVMIPANIADLRYNYVNEIGMKTSIILERSA